MSCEHKQFLANVTVQRLGDHGEVIRNFVAEIQIHCVECSEPFHFIGPSTGFAFNRPTVNVGATTLHAPIAPGEAPLPASIAFDMRGS